MAAVSEMTSVPPPVNLANSAPEFNHLCTVVPVELVSTSSPLSALLDPAV